MNEEIEKLLKDLKESEKTDFEFYDGWHKNITENYSDNTDLSDPLFLPKSEYLHCQNKARYRKDS